MFPCGMMIASKAKSVYTFSRPIQGKMQHGFKYTRFGHHAWLSRGGHAG